MNTARIRILTGILVFHCTISVHAQSTGKVMSPEKIIKLIPERISEYSSASDAKSKMIQLGTLRYTMAERNFASSQKRSIKILLFDYAEAPIMYSQATRKWSTFTTVESDSVILRPAVVTDCIGWESYNFYRKNSQVLLGICDRFFLTVEGTNVELEFLKKVIEGFKFETFPKLYIDGPKSR